MNHIDLETAKITIQQDELLIRDLVDRLNKKEKEYQRSQEKIALLERSIEEATNKSAVNRVRELFDVFENSISNLHKGYDTFDKTELCLKIEKHLRNASNDLNENNLLEVFENAIVNILESISFRQYRNVDSLVEIKEAFVTKFTKIRQNMNKLICNNDELKIELNKLQDKKINDEKDMNLSLFNYKKSLEKLKEIAESLNSNNIKSKFEDYLYNMDGLIKFNSIVDRERLKWIHDVIISKLIEIQSTVNNCEKNNKSQISSISEYAVHDNSSAASNSHTFDNVINMLDNHYKCPKCREVIQCDIGELNFQKHVKNCGPKKYTCMFCFRVFESTAQNEFNSHIYNVHRDRMH